METNTAKPNLSIRECILDKLNEFKDLDEFLTLKNVVVFDVEELPVLENELFQYMMKYKQLSQLSLNLYHNYGYVQKCKILENNRSEELITFMDNHNLWSIDDPDKPMIIPDTNRVVDYLSKYLSSYILLEKYEQRKDLDNFKSLLKSLCFYCDSTLQQGRCQICMTNSVDMREYARIHHRTLRKKSRKSAQKSRSSVMDILIESDNHESSTKLYFPRKEKLSLDGIIDAPRASDYWECRLCTSINKIDLVNCSNCYTVNGNEITKPPVNYSKDKSESPRLTIPDIPLLSNSSQRDSSSVRSGSDIRKQSITVSQTKWICWNPLCYKSNESGTNFCKKCGFQRRLARIFYRKIGGRLVEIWMCDICSQCNNLSTQMCSVCAKGTRYGSTKFWEPFA